MITAAHACENYVDRNQLYSTTQSALSQAVFSAFNENKLYEYLNFCEQ